MRNLLERKGKETKDTHKRTRFSHWTYMVKKTESHKKITDKKDMMENVMKMCMTV